MQRMMSLKTRFHWTLIANSSLATLQISNSSSTVIISQTAKVTVLNPDKNYLTETRLLFDSFRQRRYCNDNLKRILNLKKVRTEVII